jgi:hypothetical protein
METGFYVWFVSTLLMYSFSFAMFSSFAAEGSDGFLIAGIISIVIAVASTIGGLFWMSM